MRSWKRLYPGGELHHVFGRLGRDRWCRLFFVRLSPAEHHGAMSGALTRALRDCLRPHYSAYREANAAVRNSRECVYDCCVFRASCPLYEKGEASE